MSIETKEKYVSGSEAKPIRYFTTVGFQLVNIRDSTKKIVESSPYWRIFTTCVCVFVWLYSRRSCFLYVLVRFSTLNHFYKRTRDTQGYLERTYKALSSFPPLFKSYLVVALSPSWNAPSNRRNIAIFDISWPEGVENFFHREHASPGCTA